MIRAKPYQPRQGVAWLSSARVVRCVVSTRNGHTPPELLLSRSYLWLLKLGNDRTLLDIVW